MTWLPITVVLFAVLFPAMGYWAYRKGEMERGVWIGELFAAAAMLSLVAGSTLGGRDAVLGWALAILGGVLAIVGTAFLWPALRDRMQDPGANGKGERK